MSFDYPALALDSQILAGGRMISIFGIRMLNVKMQEALILLEKSITQRKKSYTFLSMRIV